MSEVVAAEALVERLLARDTSLWPAGSEAPSRLGWLDSAARLLPACAEVSAWASSLSFERVVLLGMGGSSLGPEVLRSAAGSDRLVVCDTTDPATVAAVPVEGSFFLLSSKSGGTLEPRALFSSFWSKVPDGSRWAAICDPGTAPINLAEQHGFARVFQNDPNIGGRYSVLSWFGLVPAALLGLDPAELCRGAAAVDVDEAVRLGLGWAEAQRLGRDKLTIRVPDGPFRAFGLWAEQLVAESLGKQGTGIVPVPTTEDEPGPDREPVAFQVDGIEDLGREFLRWEIATAIAGSVLDVDAFDQPDVEAAKVATAQALEHLPLPDQLPDGVEVAGPGQLLGWLEHHVDAGDYVALQAYVPYGQDEALEALRRRVRDHLGGAAVTAGYGPRFLHSTGQLHKGGPDSCVAVQIVPDAATATLAVPDHDYDFGTLIAAQSLGDLHALRAVGRRVVRVVVAGGDLTGALLTTMRIGMVGLGRMGGNMTRRLLRSGHTVVAHDVSGDAVAILVGEGATGAADLASLVAQLEPPRAVWVMLPAGPITEEALDQLAGHLDAGDVVVDGGNARWNDSVARGETLAASGIDFCDAGVSGGVWGLENGYGLMVGGADAAVERLRPLFASLAPEGGFVHVGPTGSGHYAKMVHNGIEYGLMQAYGEGFALLAAAEEFGIDQAKLAEVAEAWRHGTVIRSWLLDLAALALADDSFETVQGYVDDSGEGRWTVQEAVERGVPAPAITAALYARFSSRDANLFSNRLLAALRGQFGGHGLRVHLVDDAETPVTANPLLEGLGSDRRAPPCVLVVYGASGDLTSRKILPAIERLHRNRQLPGAFALVGTARTEMDDDDFRAQCLKSVPDAAPGWDELVKGFRYVAGDYTATETFDRLKEVLAEVDEQRGTQGNRVHYLATVPSLFDDIARALGREEMNQPRFDTSFVRIVCEKPYGRDLASARELDDAMHSAFREKQVYRIDHYLGKETVQNILALRFANTFFEPLWSRQHIDHVQVTVAEAVGVGSRAGFYETAGTLRDIVQNHVLQVLAVCSMEPPSTLDATGVRDEKVKALRAIKPWQPSEVAAHVVRAQYGPGWVEGEEVKGYRAEQGVAPDSTTDTYVALKLEIDNWRWAGVPFYIRTGKRLPKRVTEVAFAFKAVPHLAFTSRDSRGLSNNALVMRIQPDEGITLRFGAKVPGGSFEVRDVLMDFSYGASFLQDTPDAYERLLLDAMIGDPTLFIRSDEVEQAWRVCDPILEAWEDPAYPVCTYEAGSWGPAEADKLLERDGRKWRTP